MKNRFNRLLIISFFLSGHFIWAQDVDSLYNDTPVDTIQITRGDTLFYKEITRHLRRADGSPGIDVTHLVFKESNPDQYYIIRSGKGPAIKFEGRIKPGNKYHGTCIEYFSKADTITLIASEKNYFNGVKHGHEIHYNRDKSINWQVYWDMGKQLPREENNQ